MNIGQFTSNCFITGIGCAVGDLVDIGSIKELQENEDLRETLLTLGLETYSVCNSDAISMAIESIEKSLKSADIPVKEIDAIIYATSGYAMAGKSWDPTIYSHKMKTIIGNLGLEHAIPYGVSFSQCVNFIAAVEMACGLLSTKLYRNVLIVVADALTNKISRIVEPGISVISDVAASCVISKTVNKGLRIESVSQVVDWGLLDVSSSTQFSEYFKRTADGIANIADKMYTELKRTPEEFTQLITNSVNISVLRILSQKTGFPVNKIFKENIARLAHCDSADILVNLEDYLCAQNPEINSRLLAIASGPFIWGGMSLVV